MALAACRTTAPDPLPDVPPAPFDDRPPRVALVLGGGGARGFAHIGVIRVLEDARVPQLIVGTSVGSLVGAIYAGQPNSFALERMARDLDRGDFFDFSIEPALFGVGLATGDRLERFVRARSTASTFEELRVPVAAVATDLDAGELVVLDTATWPEPCARRARSPASWSRSGTRARPRRRRRRGTYRWTSRGSSGRTS